MGRSPARPTNFSNDEPRPGPAHQISVCWAAARPGHHIFEVSRPGPAHQFFKSLGPVRPGLTAHDKSWYLGIFADMFEFTSRDAVRILYIL